LLSLGSSARISFYTSSLIEDNSLFMFEIMDVDDRGILFGEIGCSTALLYSDAGVLVDG
jgi:hypothetical protein